MGQFSWLAVDTNSPIYNDGTAKQTVTMVFKDTNGEIKAVTESDYEGYGIFGGLDYYEVLAEMNGITSPIKNADERTEDLRIKGIDLVYNCIDASIQYPQLYLGIPMMERVNFANRVMEDPKQGWGQQDDSEGDSDWED